MIMKKVIWRMLSEFEICRIAHLERGIDRCIPDLHQLAWEWERLDCFLFLERERIAGFILIDPACAWLPGSIRIVKLRFSWEYNREEVICEMIRSAAAVYLPSGAAYVCLDVEKRRDVNYSLYRKLGFLESPMQSPCAQGHSVLIAPMDTLNAGSCAL